MISWSHKYFLLLNMNVWFFTFTA